MPQRLRAAGNRVLMILGALTAIAFACTAVATVSGCGLFDTKFVWPDAVKCLPQPQSILHEVEQILVTSNDVEADLHELALKEGKAAVLCAVAQFVDSIAARSQADDAAKARGRVFLKKAGTKIGS